jgi:hypothetical protein
MNEDEIISMKGWIETYFDDIVQPKIANLNKMIQHGFVEESLTLALCYIDAMTNFDRPKRSERKTTFINIIYDFSNLKKSFSKISKIYLIRAGRNSLEKNTKGGTSLDKYEEIKAALLKKYGRNNDHHQEMDKDGVIQYLRKKLRSCDWQNLEANLDNFSYAAVLYERWRSAGVHEMGFETALHNGRPLMEKNEQGEDIYYHDDILCFSKEIILSTLNNVFQNLKSTCLLEVKWPCEIIR